VASVASYLMYRARACVAAMTIVSRRSALIGQDCTLHAP
jgi:hypothetical protein